MFAIPGIVLLLMQGYLRPQEYFVSLQSVPFVYLYFAIALFGLAVDLRLRKTQLTVAPHLGWGIAVICWALFTLALRLPSALQAAAIDLAIPFTFFFLIAQGVQSFRALSTVAASLLIICLCLAAIGVHQGLAPMGCYQLDPTAVDTTGVYDGRSCDTDADCRDEPDADFNCEHVGLFGTSSVIGRVRYRGALNDPNELALALSISLPFAFAFFERKRSTGRLMLLVTSLVLIGLCVFMTKSRGGQLVFLTVLAVYFGKRYGVRGLIAGAILAAPMLLLAGGRSDADESSRERLEMMHAAIQLVGMFPIRGVGYAQILDWNRLTAHNSYALAAAELGFPGLVIWTSMLYLAVKIVITVLRRYADDASAAVARTWALALLASLGGMAIGIFFLSFCYNLIFWIYMGIIAGFYQAIRAHDSDFEVRIDRTDLLRLIGIDFALVLVIWGYTTIKLASPP